MVNSCFHSYLPKFVYNFANHFLNLISKLCVIDASLLYIYILYVYCVLHTHTHITQITLKIGKNFPFSWHKHCSIIQ